MGSERHTGNRAWRGEWQTSGVEPGNVLKRSTRDYVGAVGLEASLVCRLPRGLVHTEVFEQPQRCDQLAIDNDALAIVIGHEPLTPDIRCAVRYRTRPR